jgi:hypothetical protein
MSSVRAVLESTLEAAPGATLGSTFGSIFDDVFIFTLRFFRWPGVTAGKTKTRRNFQRVLEKTGTTRSETSPTPDAMPRNSLQGSGGNHHRFGWFYEHPKDAAGIVLNGQ